jgi:DNA-binding transcriptional ArsR family regulator
VDAFMDGLDDAALERVAAYFKALSEPTRLKLLNALRPGERNVGALTAEIGVSQASVSKHLAVLLAAGVVERTTRGTNSLYRIADPGTYQLCDLVCGQIGKRFASEIAQRTGFIAAAGARRNR